MKAKIDVQYFGDESIITADSIILEFNEGRERFSVEYDNDTGSLVARIVFKSVDLNKNEGKMQVTTSQSIERNLEHGQERERWVLEKRDIEDGNFRFKIVIGPSFWRFQWIKKEVQVLEIESVKNKISTDRITFEYAAPLSKVSKIVINAKIQ